MSKLLLKLSPFFLLFLLYSSSASAATLSRPPTNQGLVGYWSFNEGAGTVATDFSGSGNRGVLVNGPTWSNGRLGKALSFDGSDDYVNVPSALSSLSGSVTTFSAWIKIRAYDANGCVLFGTNTGSSVYWQITNTGTPPSSMFVMANEVVISSALNDNTWRHIVATSDGTTSRVYVNGVQEGSNSGAVTALASGAKNFAIGDWIGSLASNWSCNGLLDEVRIYNRALSADEVKALYQTTAAKFKPPDNRGLVGYWSFNEGAGTVATDFSGSGNRGVLTNGPAWSNGRLGKALSFDGSNDEISVPSSASLEIIGTQITMSAWVRKTATGVATGRRQVILAKLDALLTVGGYSIDFRDDNGTDMFSAYIANASGSPCNVTQTSDIPAEWIHFTATYDGANIRIYKNGVQIGSCAYTANIPSTTDSLKIGRRPGSGTFFPGLIDEVRIYNRALTPSEVAGLYKSGAAKFINPDNRGLVGYWSFNDGAGTVATDFSGSGNRGVLVNDPVWSNGRLGKALSFDGSNDYVNASNVNLGLNGQTQVSASFWLNSTDTSGRVIQKEITDGWSSIVVYFGSITAGKIGFSTQSNSIIQFPTWDQTSAAINDGKWHHVAVTFSRNNINSTDGVIYIDGVAVSTTFTANGYTSGFTLQESANNLLFGIRPITFTDPFGGLIDEVRVYNRALTADEVRALYNSR